MSEHTKESLSAMNRISELTKQRDALLAACGTLVKATFQEDITKATRQAKAAIAAANKE